MEKLILWPFERAKVVVLTRRQAVEYMKDMDEYSTRVSPISCAHEWCHKKLEVGDRVIQEIHIGVPESPVYFCSPRCQRDDAALQMVAKRALEDSLNEFPVEVDFEW